MDAITVLGAGGIGCAVGYALLEQGVTVTFVDSRADKVRAGSETGVRVDGRPNLPARFISFDHWHPVPDSVVLLCVKCYDNTAVLERVTTSVQLIPIQNGFDPALAARDHTAEGIASFVSEASPDRPHARITRPGELHLGPRGLPTGSPPGSKQPTLDQLVGVLRPSTLFKTVAVAQIEPIKYAKLMYNAAISPLAAAAGLDNGKLLSLPLARRLFFGLIQENYRILNANGIELGKVGPFRPRTVAWILRRRWLASIMARGFEPSLRGTYCSMAGEIQKGRTEVDNYNGHLIELAQRAGVNCPLNRAVYDLVTRMTHERANPHIGRLDEVARSGE